MSKTGNASKQKRTCERDGENAHEKKTPKDIERKQGQEQARRSAPVTAILAPKTLQNVTLLGQSK